MITRSRKIFLLVILGLGLGLGLGGCGTKDEEPVSAIEDKELLTEMEEIPKGKVLFRLDRKEGDVSLSEIYIMNTDGSENRKLAEGKHSSFSPDGTKVLFTSRDGEVCIINIDGSGTKKLAKGDYPRFFPDGSKILFNTPSQHGEGKYDLYTMNCDGTNRVILVEGVSNSQLSPSGDKVLFVSAKGDKDELCIMNTDGTDLKILEEKSDFGSIKFSPDGEKILAKFYEYITKIRGRSQETEYKERGFLIMNVDGSEKVKIIEDPSEGYFGDYPSFSPDSKMIAFETYIESHKRGWYRCFNVGIVNVDGAGKKILTDNRYYTVLFMPPIPTFTPDGKKIIYYSVEKKTRRKNEVKIRIVNLEGTENKILTGDGAFLDFTPDGKKIILEVEDPVSNKNGIYAINLDGTGKRKLADLPEGDHSFSFFWPK